MCALWLSLGADCAALVAAAALNDAGVIPLDPASSFLPPLMLTLPAASFVCAGRDCAGWRRAVPERGARRRRRRAHVADVQAARGPRPRRAGRGHPADRRDVDQRVGDGQLRAVPGRHLPLSRPNHHQQLHTGERSDPPWANDHFPSLPCGDAPLVCGLHDESLFRLHLSLCFNTGGSASLYIRFQHSRAHAWGSLLLFCSA